MSSLASAFIFVSILSSILGLCILPLVVRSEQEETVPVAAGDLKVKKERKRSTSRTSLSEAGPQRRRSMSLQREGQPTVCHLALHKLTDLTLSIGKTGSGGSSHPTGRGTPAQKPEKTYIATIPWCSRNRNGDMMLLPIPIIFCITNCD